MGQRNPYNRLIRLFITGTAAAHGWARSHLAKVIAAGPGSNPTRVLAEAMVMVALAFLLYLVKVFQLPEGGSITLGSMVPIFLLSFRRGAKVGVASGTVLGLIILYYEKFIYNPFQVFLDYPLAFAVLGISGLFRRNPFVGIGVAISARFACHFLSGVLFFQSFAPEGTNPILYSVLYNASYLVPEFIISVAVMYFLMKRDILAVRL